MDKKEIMCKLADFNKQAEDLFKLSFIEKSADSGYTISAKIGEPVKCILKGPDDESIKAFVNDIRRFFQNNDSLRIHKLIPFYQSDLVEEPEKRLFNKVMSDYDNFNKTSVNNNIITKDKQGNIIKQEILTNERVLEVFLYGKISHRTEGTKEEHDHWESFEPLYISLKNDFICALNALAIFVNNIVCVNNVVLQKLKD